MEWFIKWFIRSSLLWFAAGIVLGLAMGIRPRWVIYRPAHAHMNVAGFLTLLVFGVGYQLLPRLFGAQLHSRRAGVAHLYLANGGLLLFVTGFAVQAHDSAWSAWLIGGGGSLYTMGALLWVWNLWSTFNVADARVRARVADAGRPLDR